MNAIASQRKALYRLFSYNKETEAVHVQQITGDKSKTTAGDLTIPQAAQLIKTLTTNWAEFDKYNGRHIYILSLMRQLKWTKPHTHLGTVPDMYRLSKFLQSFRSPVQKPLQDMEPAEVSKVIVALEGIVKSTYQNAGS